MTKDHFKTINGYSNLFFGWGGEDDDLFNRCVLRNLITIVKASTFHLFMFWLQILTFFKFTIIIIFGLSLLFISIYDQVYLRLPKLKEQVSVF